MSVCRQAETMFSPRAWGWTDVVRVECADGEVFPTRVGMDRCSHELGRGPVRFPHARGDGPAGVPPVRGDIPFSPRAWGWTGGVARLIHGPQVFPTRVGMDRLPPSHHLCNRRFPHARGDGPDRFLCLSGRLAFSPRAWGWTGRRATLPPRQARFPHARGDGPYAEYVVEKPIRFSPRAWGWTGYKAPQTTPEPVFPTRVGMDRRHRAPPSNLCRFPHARGDGPDRDLAYQVHSMFSPRAWGWTASHHREADGAHVFPTRVGMDRTPELSVLGIGGFPHARGDGPRRGSAMDSLLPFSPRAWVWTGGEGANLRVVLVFPTRVGMDRLTRCVVRWWRCFPHARGDGPGYATPYADGSLVFPTRVGMDRPRR